MTRPAPDARAFAAAVLLVLLLAACGNSAATSSSVQSVGAVYRAKIERIARRTCDRHAVKALARQLHTTDSAAKIADAYARTWPNPVRDAARAGCLQGLTTR